MNKNTSDLWDAAQWASDFSAASKARYAGDYAAADTLHDLRARVFADTVERVRAGGYVLADGTRVDLPLSPTVGDDTRFYDRELPAGPAAAPDAAPAPVEVREGDCLVVARELVEAGESEVCVLNMASRRNPGGGVLGGAGAQEEHLFRSSDYFRSLYRFADYAASYGVPRAAESYPLDRDHGGVFSRGVTVFRGPEGEGYPLLAKPWRCNFVAVPAIPHPDTVPGPDGAPRLAPAMEAATRRKIRAILRIARENGQRALVLSAFGCGAFRNPPRHMAELFRDELASPEFRATFDRVVFSVIDDHNARGEGNLRPFREVFA